MATTVENCYAKWKLGCEHRIQYGWQENLPKKLKRTEANKDEVDPNAKYHDAKFTSSETGQAEFGTFSPQGKKYYEEMLAKITTNKTKNRDKILELEAKMLGKLKLSVKEANAKKKRKNSHEVAADDQPPAKDQKMTWDMTAEF